MVWQNFFDPHIQILRRKHSAFEVPDLPGLWRVHWRVGDRTLISTFYTRHDQACILWSILAAIIFFTIQFYSLSWFLQAILASGLTFLGVLSMIALTQHRVQMDGLHSVLQCWVLLMTIGTLLTDLSVFLGWSWLLMHLCSLWLSLSAIGYFYTGVKMRSRAFLILCVIHLCGVLLLPYVQGWHFLTTGFIIATSVWLIGELRWDWVREVESYQGSAL
jgi:hypothetical protein